MAYSLRRQDSELGIVRLCRKCDEEWPLDQEFWYLDPNGYVSGSMCRACWGDRRSKRVREHRMALAAFGAD